LYKSTTAFYFQCKNYSLSNHTVVVVYSTTAFIFSGSFEFFLLLRNSHYFSNFFIALSALRNLLSKKSVYMYKVSL